MRTTIATLDDPYWFSKPKVGVFRLLYDGLAKHRSEAWDPSSDLPPQMNKQGAVLTTQLNTH
jgi:hypothetical protein